MCVWLYCSDCFLCPIDFIGVSSNYNTFNKWQCIVSNITWVYFIYWMLLKSSKFLERCVILFTLTFHTNNICSRSRLCQNLVMFHIIGLCSMNRLQIWCHNIFGSLCYSSHKNDIIAEFGLNFGAFEASRIFSKNAFSILWEVAFIGELLRHTLQFEQSFDFMVSYQ